jgi:hypothetical protein
VVALERKDEKRDGHDHPQYPRDDGTEEDSGASARER